MAGLLDSFNNEDQLLMALSLMAAGAPKAQRTSLGEGLLGAFQAGRANQTAREDRTFKQQFQQAQIADFQAQAAQRQAQAQEMQRKAQESARIQSLLQRSFMPVTGAQANAASGITGPRPEALSVVGQRPQVDYQQLLAQGVPHEIVKSLAEARNYGRDKVARTVKGLGPDGREYEYQVDEYGNKVGSPFQQYKAPIQADMGGSVTWRDAYDPTKVIASAGKTMTPDGQASNAVAWSRLTFDKQKDAREQQQPKGQYDAERGLIIDPRTGQATPVTQGGQPIGPKNKEMTDSQAKALLFGQRAKDADAILNKMAAAGTNRPSIIKQGVEGIPGVGGALGAAANAFIATPDQQSVEQAQRDFVNAVLRRESGAVISPSEFANAQQQYFPQVGDTPQVIAQKAKNRALATDLIMREVPAQHRGQAGGGAPSLDDLLKKYGG